MPSQRGSAANPFRRELQRRMARPQRHRLLQGYPMAPLMRAVDAGFDPFASVEIDPARQLLVGVLPHTFCNPKVRGCGFCTFPHEKLPAPVEVAYDARRRRAFRDVRPPEET